MFLRTCGLLAVVILTASTAQADSEWLLPVSCIGFGLGSAALVTGAVTGGLALAKSTELETACATDGSCPAYRAGDIESMRALSHASTASWVVAGVGLAAGIGALVFYEVSDDEVSARLVVSPGSAGLTLSF